MFNSYWSTFPHTGLEPHFTCHPIEGHVDNQLQTRGLNITDTKNGSHTLKLKSMRDECPNNDLSNCRLVFDDGYKSFAQEVVMTNKS